MFISGGATRHPVFDAPLDTWYIWLGLCAVSVAVAVTALGFPTAAPPDAAVVADAVDSVASGEAQNLETVPIHADSLRLGPHRVALRSDGGRSHARIAFGPVTPVRTDRLEAVLDGTRPATLYRSASAFESALERARSGRTDWLSAPARLTIRHVSWRGVNATLVG